MSAGSLVRAVVGVSLTATDLDRTRAFYAALGFAADPVERLAEAELADLGATGSRADRLPLRLGGTRLEVLRFAAPGRPYPAGSTATDLWFQHVAIVVSDIAAAHRHALAAGAAPISLEGPEVLPPNTGRVAAWKFRDPDGHPLELLHFPPGTGASAWQRRGGATPFLGIDHTAMAVSDPDGSRAFYGSLGFTVGGETLNRGPEQERLDGVEGARVNVVAMKPPVAPPHLELLAYAVGSRRPLPAATRAQEIWATRTILAVTDAARLPPHDPDGHPLVGRLA